MSANVPTLSSAGFVSDPARKLDHLMSYFFIAEYSQSTVHAGYVTSLPYLIKNHAHDPAVLVDRIETSLKRMLDGYFEDVTINVTLDPVKEENQDPKIDIQVEGIVVDEGKSYPLAKLLSIANDKLTKVSDLQIR